MSSGYF